jgi:hypothetical protein
MLRIYCRGVFVWAGGIIGKHLLRSYCRGVFVCKRDHRFSFYSINVNENEQISFSCSMYRLPQTMSCDKANSLGHGLSVAGDTKCGTVQLYPRPMGC